MRIDNGVVTWEQQIGDYGQELPHGPKAVRFAEPFDAPPVVLAALSGLEVRGGNGGLRVALRVSNVEQSGFTLTVEGGSSLARIEASWLAHDGG